MKTVSTGSWVTVYMLIQESGVSRLRGHSVLVSAGDEVILFNGIRVHSVPVSTWEGVSLHEVSRFRGQQVQ